MNWNAGYGTRVERGLPGVRAFLTKGKKMGKTAETIRVLLADDYPAIRAGIRTILEKAPDVRVVGEATGGAEAMQLTAQLRPQLLLLDLRMPGPRPAEIARWVRNHCPETETLVLTAHDIDRYVAEMMEAGTAGFLTKEKAEQALLGAIRRAARGEILYTKEQRARARRWREEVGQRWERLTERERQVLALMAEGKTDKEIAQELQIKTKTVGNHVSRILRKLGVTSRTEAALWAVREGFVD